MINYIQVFYFILSINIVVQYRSQIKEDNLFIKLNSYLFRRDLDSYFYFIFHYILVKVFIFNYYCNHKEFINIYFHFIRIKYHFIKNTLEIFIIYKKNDENYSHFLRIIQVILL